MAVTADWGEPEPQNEVEHEVWTRASNAIPFMAYDDVEPALTRSCASCMRRPEEHVQGKCILASTTYEAFGDKRAAALMDRWLGAADT